MNTPFDFLECFRHQVIQRPDETALTNEENSYSYRKLWNESTAVAAGLLKCFPAETLIGIDAEEGMRSYTYILGVWLAGKAYVPIHRTWPPSKLKQVIKESSLCVFLSEKQLEGMHGVELGSSVEPDFFSLPSFDLAYVLFTSGSTGVPKGVQITTQNLNGFLNHFLSGSTYNFNSTDRFLQSYELSFDVSVMCFLLPWSVGASLYLPREGGIKFLQLLRALGEHQITVCSNVPSIIRYAGKKLGELQFESLRYAFFSGDALYGNEAELWMSVCSNARVYNCYGPTETTIICTEENLNDLPSKYFNSSDPLPLGEVFSGMELQLIDGEICFAGKQVFKGYLNAANPIIEVDQKAFYPTKDTGHFDKNGKLIFDGRSDLQVQIDGYRVELEEVERVYRSILNQQCVAKAVSGLKGLELILFVEGKPSIDKEELSAMATEFLPSYAVPKRIQAVPQFPLNQNGKIDRSKLEISLH